MKYYLTLMFCLLVASVFAQTDKDLLLKYAEAISEVQSLYSRFSEEKHLSLLNKPLESEGRLVFDKKAKKLRWQYQKPFEKGFLIEQKDVYQLTNGKKQLVENTIGRMMAAQMLVWLTLDFNSLKDSYQISADKNIITFIPKDTNNKAVKQIMVWLEEKDPRLVTKVKMSEPGGDFIIWKFSDTRLNAPLKEGDFLL
ncbi:MAG: outer membrane lipoprotein carrier protein LolA [Elusimicrobiaceae bacterium]